MITLDLESLWIPAGGAAREEEGEEKKEEKKTGHLCLYYEIQKYGLLVQGLCPLPALHSVG